MHRLVAVIPIGSSARSSSGRRMGGRHARRRRFRQRRVGSDLVRTRNVGIAFGVGRVQPGCRSRAHGYGRNVSDRWAVGGRQRWCRIFWMAQRCPVVVLPARRVDSIGSPGWWRPCRFLPAAQLTLQEVQGDDRRSTSNRVAVVCAGPGVGIRYRGPWRPTISTAAGTRAAIGRSLFPLVGAHRWPTSCGIRWAFDCMCLVMVISLLAGDSVSAGWGTRAPRPVDGFLRTGRRARVVGRRRCCLRAASSTDNGC